MWETSAVVEVRASATAIWELWGDATRWKDWNAQIASVDLREPLAVGSKVRIRFKRRLPLTFTITALEHGRLLTDETRLPGARLGHEHRLDITSDGAAKVRNRLYLEGPAERLWALFLGR